VRGVGVRMSLSGGKHENQIRIVERCKMNIVIGDTFRAKSTGAKYIVEHLDGDEITLRCIDGMEAEVDIYLDDVPKIFDNLRTDV